MSEKEILAAILQKLSEKATQAAIPVEIDLWDTEHIAAYLKYSYSTVRDKILPLPSFPRPISIRTVNGAGLPRYKAREVILWAESLQS
jgi:hypothetical protein